MALRTRLLGDSPWQAAKRVQRYGRGAGVPRTRGVGVARVPGGVAVGDPVTVAVAVAVAVGVAVALPVAVAVGGAVGVCVAVAVAVGVGVGVPPPPWQKISIEASGVMPSTS